MDKRYIKPDGSIVWVHMVVAPLNVSKYQLYSYICLVQDITERKEFEEALHESERSKSVFLLTRQGSHTGAITIVTGQCSMFPMAVIILPAIGQRACYITETCHIMTSFLRNTGKLYE